MPGRIVIASSDADAASVGESAGKPLTALALSASDFTLLKTAVILALSKELVVGLGGPGLRFLERWLRRGVARETDRAALVAPVAPASRRAEQRRGTACSQSFKNYRTWSDRRRQPIVLDHDKPGGEGSARAAWANGVTESAFKAARC